MQSVNRLKLVTLRLLHEDLIKQERKKLTDKSSNPVMKTKLTNVSARPTPSPANIQSKLMDDDISSVDDELIDENEVLGTVGVGRKSLYSLRLVQLDPFLVCQALVKLALIQRQPRQRIGTGLSRRGKRSE
jgi:hypothetical protein